jgi:DNA polymerase III alpha subunit (gram-positive type)
MDYVSLVITKLGGTVESKARFILYDIETTHNVAAIFQLKNQDYIQPENILAERYIVCAGWKELGKSRIHSVSVLDDPKRFKRDSSDDYYVVKKLHDVLSQADVIIAHNGDQFDLKFTEARILIHGLSPLPTIPKIDTLKIARDRFLFNANNLNYLGKILGVGGKKHTGNGLWLRVLNGDVSAIREMVRYNKQDVALLERVFLKFQPYINNHVNRQLLGETGCPRCGSANVQSRGTHKAITRTYQRFQCQACGGWYRLLKAEGQSTKYRVL